MNKRSCGTMHPRRIFLKQRRDFASSIRRQVAFKSLFSSQMHQSSSMRRPTHACSYCTLIPLSQTKKSPFGKNLKHMKQDRAFQNTVVSKNLPLLSFGSNNLFFCIKSIGQESDLFMPAVYRILTEFRPLLWQQKQTVPALCLSYFVHSILLNFQFPSPKPRNHRFEKIRIYEVGPRFSKQLSPRTCPSYQGGPNG